MTIEESLAKIYSLHQFDIKLGLNKINHLLGYLGNPQKQLKTIHIAGSNGKGSVSSYLASILFEAGYKVGLYTSPHVVKFNERIRINGTMIEDEYINNFIFSIDSYIREYKPTFFEITTALAFKYFAENNIDIGIIETGLGGRLDATNVLEPIATVITSISLEHTNILGDTIEKIAFEKAGIIKEKTNCFLGLVPMEAEKVISKKCEENHSELIILKKCIDFNNKIFNISCNNFIFHIYNPVLKGNHQYYNLSLAILVLQKTFNLSDWQIYNKGINNIIKNSGFQCRYEILNNEPKIIFDAAHNSEGIESFVNQFTKEKNDYNNVYFIFGAMKDKNIEEMLSKLKPFSTKLYFTQINYERAATPEILSQIADKLNIINEIVTNPEDYINKFKQNKNNSKNCLVVLGSIYLLGQVKNKMIEKKYLTM